MSKQEDLKLVFDFIAEYLKGSENKTMSCGETGHAQGAGLIDGETGKEIGVEDKFNVNQILGKLKEPITNIGGDATYIKNLMERVESKSIEQATTNNALATQRREFEAEIRRLKGEVVEDLIKEKNTEENITLSGDNATLLNNSDILETYQ